VVYDKMLNDNLKFCWIKFIGYAGWHLMAVWGCDSKSSSQEFELLERDALIALDEHSSFLTDEQLAKGYCGTCHDYPDPEVLDKPTWIKTVLPNMRRRLGLVFPEENRMDEQVLEGQVFHNDALITKENWERIEAFYEAYAPEKLNNDQNVIEPNVGVPGFKLDMPTTTLKQPALTTSLKGDGEGGFYLGDRINGLYLIDGTHLNVKQKLPNIHKVSSIFLKGQNHLTALKMGKMDPADEFAGEWVEINDIEESVILKGLNRPVHISMGKIIEDDPEAVIISNFGNHKGDVSLYIKNHHEWERSILLNRPGARKSIIADLNGNGHNDIIVLMTQAREAIVAFMNQGNGLFEEKQLLTFHPAFGSSDFDLLDMNGNGKLDIVLTNGDNADLSKILKPYHGVRIYENQGQERYEEAWFYPMHGAMGLVAHDFDGNGHIDIAAISFFPDWNQEPRQDFIYFKGQGNFGFKAYVLDKPLKAKWLIIEKSDIDGDGDQDIILGSFMLEQLPPRDGSPHYFDEKWFPFAVLRNQLFPN
jgi:hypothetical protein